MAQEKDLIDSKITISEVKTCHMDGFPYRKAPNGVNLQFKENILVMRI